MIFSKIFFGVWLARKNYKMQKLEFDKCLRNPATSGRRCQIPARKFDRIRPKWPDFDQKLPDPAVLARSRLFWPDPTRAGRIPAVLAKSGNIPAGIWWPSSGAGRIPAIGCCRTPGPVGFRRSTIAKF